MSLDSVDIEDQQVISRVLKDKITTYAFALSFLVDTIEDSRVLYTEAVTGSNKNKRFNVDFCEHVMKNINNLSLFNTPLKSNNTHFDFSQDKLTLDVYNVPDEYKIQVGNILKSTIESTHSEVHDSRQNKFFIFRLSVRAFGYR